MQTLSNLIRFTTSANLTSTTCNYGVYNTLHYTGDICLYTYNSDNEDISYPHFTRIECEYTSSEPQAFYRPYYDSNCTQPINHDENEMELAQFRCCQNCSTIDDCHPFYMVETKYEHESDKWGISNCADESLLISQIHFALYSKGSGVCANSNNPLAPVSYNWTYSYDRDNLRYAVWFPDTNCSGDPYDDYLIESGCNWIDVTGFDGSLDIEICENGDCITHYEFETTTTTTTTSAATTTTTAASIGHGPRPNTTMKETNDTVITTTRLYTTAIVRKPFSTHYWTSCKDIERKNNDSQIKSIENATEYMGIAMIGVLFIIIIIGIIVPRLEKFKGSDRFFYGNVIGYIASTFDFWTDLLFSFVLYLRCDYTLFYASITFTIIPSMLSLGFIVYWIQKWRLMTASASHRLVKNDTLDLIVVDGKKNIQLSRQSILISAANPSRGGGVF